MKFLAEALKVNTTLEEIYLDDNKIDDEGAKHLARTLMANKTLQHIDLHTNDISDEGARCLATALLLNQGIRYMDLYNNKIGYWGAKKLADALKYYNNNIKTLWLGGHQTNNSMSEKVNVLVEDTNREQRELTSLQLREIIAMQDEETADNVKAIVQLGASLKASEEEKKELEQKYPAKTVQLKKGVALLPRKMKKLLL